MLIKMTLQNRVMENSLHIPERSTMRTGDILKKSQKKLKCLLVLGRISIYLIPFIQKSQYIQSYFRLIFHMVKYSYCNLNPTDQNKNQSALSLLKTMKQIESY